jgi:BMFP domain-containing protein YqiC
VHQLPETAALHWDPASMRFRLERRTAMEKTAFLDELQQRLSSLLEGTPAADLQRNLKALLSQQFAELDLVTREEFDLQARVLARSREKLRELERRLADLEAKRA